MNLSTSHALQLHAVGLFPVSTVLMRAKCYITDKTTKEEICSATISPIVFMETPVVLQAHSRFTVTVKLNGLQSYKKYSSMIAANKVVQIANTSIIVSASHPLQLHVVGLFPIQHCANKGCYTADTTATDEEICSISNIFVSH